MCPTTSECASSPLIKIKILEAFSTSLCFFIIVNTIWLYLLTGKTSFLFFSTVDIPLVHHFTNSFNNFIIVVLAGNTVSICLVVFITTYRNFSADILLILRYFSRWTFYFLTNASVIEKVSKFTCFALLV